ITFLPLYYMMYMFYMFQSKMYLKNMWYFQMKMLYFKDQMKQFYINTINSPLMSSKYMSKNTNSNMLSLITGFMDGDGYFRMTKKIHNNMDYIYISLMVNLKYSDSDLEMLNYFKSSLNLGKVYNITPKKGNKLIRWEMSKTDMKNMLMPLLDYHNMIFLTENRQKQFLLSKYIINNNITYYKDLNTHKEKMDEYIKDNNITNKFDQLNYMDNWIIGFTMAEGSFLVKKNTDICYQLKQKYNFELFNCIRKVFNMSKGMSINKNKYMQFSVSSKKDMQKIINFFNHENAQPLLGSKTISYKKWMMELQHSNRYKNLVFNIESLDNKHNN
uniref:LAGLIDADG endonuclease n=1 Tax=Saccharomycopsis fibuligera TaxID=4944 RepID=UPI002A8415F3